MKSSLSTCPCCSQKSYEACCAPFHRGVPAENALMLMRSRFAAYALKLSQYIIATTHPENSQYLEDHKQWAHEIEQFSTSCDFQNLKIEEFKEDGDRAIVVFRAELLSGGQDVSFTEISTFQKVDGKWFYLKGEIAP